MSRTLTIWGAALLSGILNASQTETQYLSGHGKDDAVAWDFLCTGGMRSNTWTTIPVPSCWEQEGFGAYGYQIDPVEEKGRYRHRFSIPENWKGKVIQIVFEGVMTDTEVWLNGLSAGQKHQGGFYRFTYDVTRIVNPGTTNLLEVTVAKRSANEGVNRAERTGDYWNFGGIFRPVYLEALPPTFIERTALDARADGSFELAVHLGGHPTRTERVSAVIEGLDSTMEAAADPSTRKAVLRTQVRNQKNWTAETPHLYQVKIVLTSDGKPTHEAVQRFGFRTVEVREGKGLFVNGQRVLLKGACRHSFWPESARTLSEAISRADVALMKEMNMNAVRMSHYPPDSHFLDACDEMGLYVLNELSGWQQPHDTAVGEKLVREMITRDVNHPCIVLWDNGNEGGWNTDLDDDFAVWDPQKRHVIHPWAVSQGIDASHYKNYESVKKSCAGPTVYMPTEFLHALYDGGGGAGLDDYWEIMRTSPVSAGGFIWALVDEGVARTDQGGKIDVHGNRAPDGLVGPHREREGSFNTVREIWCPVQIRGDTLPTLTVENRYDFTDLGQCRFDWALARFPLPQETGAGHAIIAHGTMPGPEVKPHAKGSFQLVLPADRHDADALFVTARDPAGHELWTWSWLLQPRASLLARAMRPEAIPPVRIEEADGKLKVTAGTLMIAFNTSDGMLSSATVRSKPISLTNGPRFVASATQKIKTAPTKGQKPKSVTAMLDLKGQSKLTSQNHRMQDSDAVIDATFDGPLQSTRWTVHPNGWIRLDYTYRLDQACDLCGIQFDYPAQHMKSVRWLGKGPYRVWKNRLKGTCWDVWQNTYNNGRPGESWNYPEFKGYFGDWLWASFETNQGRITAMTGAEHAYLGIYRPNEGHDAAHTKLYTSETGLAFLDAIPPIGTKFSDANQYGPQSQPNPAPGICTKTVYLRLD